MIKISSFLTSSEAKTVENALKGRGIQYFVSTKGSADGYHDPYYQISVPATYYILSKRIIAKVLAKAFVNSQKCPKCTSLKYKVIPTRTLLDKIYFFGTTRVKCLQCKTKYVI